MKLLAAFFFLLVTQTNADVSVGVCSRSCVLEDSSAKYEEGMQYQYQYQGEVITKALATGQEESRLAVTAQLLITANTPCDLKLQVTNVVVEDTNDDSKWFSEAVQEHDLHFSYQHGAITHLCPHEEEEAVATNFKRGILSSLQMTATHKCNQSDIIVNEVDVSGECDVKYSLEMNPTLQVTKTKVRCNDNTYIPSLPHSHYTNIKGNTPLPFTTVSHTCHMHGNEGTGPRGDIDASGGGGVWEKVTCSEEVQVHQHFSPGSNGSSLASVSMSSTLTLEEGPKPMDGNFSKGDELTKRVSLVADLKAAVDFAEMKKLSVQNVKEQLDSVLESLSPSEEPGQDELRPRLFSTLVQLLGFLDEEGLDDVWSSSSSESTRRKLLLDGLLVCDASPCHSLVAQLAQDQKVLSQGQLNMWLTGLHMHSSAEPSFVIQLLNLAETKHKVVATATMAAASVVHQLCQQQPSECMSHAQPFLEYVDQQVGESCGLGKTKQYQGYIKMVLRAMGNAGVLPSDIFPEKCYLNRALPPDLRITALQSYRRTSCKGVETPWKLLEDVSERSEVRIAAYLALVPCAAHTSGFFTRIHKLLQKEEVHQVYSFIWTHVKNLADQPGPSKHDQELSKLARQHTLPNKFNNDAFRSSGNFRYNHFSESLNLGGSVDANVVYSHDFYVPQQVSANLTLDLLDNSFNFLDFGGEFSGIENIIESYFGKDGYFKNDDILKVLQNLRPKRNIIHGEKIQEFQKMYDDAKDEREVGLETDDIVEEEPKPSFYVRIFGNEVLYVENILQHSPAQLLYQLTQELSSPKTFKILDQEYMTPTLLGFPLRLKINATASVSLQHEYAFHNTKKLGLQLEGSLTPSVVAAIDETLLVDAFVSSTGLRRSSTQVAKVTIGGQFSVQDNEVVEMQVSVPESEVIKVSSSVKVALLKGDGKWEEPESNLKGGLDHCITTVEEVLGFRMCMNHSHSQYEVDGNSITAEPSEIIFLVEKTDSFKYYKLYIKQQESIIEALFDTPGSTVDRKIHFLFNMNPDRESGDIVIRGAGYGIKGQYENSEASPGLHLQYLQASKVFGELKMSLERQQEGLNQEYMPKFLIILGPDKFTLEGKFKYSTDDDPNKVEASWEVGGAWQKKETDMVTQAYGTTSGNIFAGQDEFKLHLNTDYSTDPSEPHSITLTLNSNQTLHKDMNINTGYASLQISQIPASITVEYERGPDLFELSSNASLQTTQVSSEVVLKNVKDKGGQDTQLTLSLASQQLDFDYKASGIYKVSESGFQAEAELNFDSSLKSKLLLMYLFEDEPLHVLTGLHLILNDFVFQVGHSIDLTQPDHLLITASTTVGERTAGLYFEADYGPDQPFNTSLEVSAGVGNHSVGLSSHTLSDLRWQNFTGKSTIKWFDWSGSLNHELVFNENTKAVKLSLENMGSLELLYETSPNQTLKVVVRDATEDNTPTFMMGVNKHMSSEHSLLQLNLKASDSQLVHLDWHMNSENLFNLTLLLLESELNIGGQYSVMDNGTASGDVHAQIMLPSGESISSNLSLSYVKMENEQLVVISASHEESTVEGQLRMSQGGTFAGEKSGIDFTLTTPHQDFQKLGFVFYKSGDAHNLYTAEIELDKFKILGDVQLSDPSNMLVKLEYQGGEECSSHLHLEHSHSEHQSISIVNITLTQTSKPWELVLNTSLDHSSHQHFLDTKLSIQAPVMPHPLHFQGMYNVTENQVQLEIETGLEESISVLYHGKKELSWKRHLLSGLGKIEASWIEPLSVNITYDHTLGSININVDLQSEEDYINSWSAEFSSEYSSAENIKANVILTHTDLQITMGFVHNQFENSWKQQLEGSINTFTVTYNTNLEWNEYLVPIKSEGSLSLFNFLDHSLDLSLSHMEESSAYISEVHGTFDDYTFSLDHKLEPKESEEGWQDHLVVTLRNVGVSTDGTTLTVNTHGNWPAVNSSLKFESPWTDSFSGNFVIQEMDSLSNVILESFYDDKSLLSTHIVCDCWPSWKKSDLKLKATSAFLEDLELKLQHNFDYGNLVIGEVTYGSDVHVEVGSLLKMKETWFEEEFQFYVFNATVSITKFDIDFKGMGAVDSNFNGTLKLHWNENNFSINTSILSGNVFEAEMRNSEMEYQSELKYEFGNETLLTLNFTLQEEMENVIFFQTIVESVNPKLNVMSTLDIFTNQTNKYHGEILVTADLTNIEKYSLQGKVEMNSNIFASKEYGGLFDLDLNFNNKLNWKGLVEVAVTGGDWDIKSGVNTSLEVNQDLAYFESGGKLHLVYGNETYDLKDVRVVLSAQSNGAYELRMIVQPSHTDLPWSLAIIYNHRYGALKGFLSLGHSRKYELSSRLSSRTLTVDAHQVNEDNSKWQIVEGNVNWILKRTKQLITMNMKSDIPSISKITGKIIVQKKRGLAVTATLKVNDDQFRGNLRLSTLEPGRSFRVDIKLDNSIIKVFESEIAVELSYTPNDLTFNVKIGFNEKSDWIEGYFKLSVKESHLKLRTPLSFMEDFNITVRTETSDGYGFEITIGAPQLCWNLTVNCDVSLLDASLDMNLDLFCNKVSLFDFKFQYNLKKNPIGILCELNTSEYGSLFKFNATGNLTSKGITLKFETEVYPEHSLGVLLATEVGDEFFVNLQAYDPPSSNGLFIFNIFVSVSKAELLFELSEGKSFIMKADYGFQNQDMKLRISITNSLFDYEFIAGIDGKASLGVEGGNIELSFTSDTVFANFSVSGLYSFLDELKDLSFTILTPTGNASGEIQILQDKDFLIVKADMTSSLHTFQKYHFELTHSIEDTVETLMATITQDDIEYHINGLKETTDKGTKGNVSVSLPFEIYEHFSLSYNHSKDGTYQGKFSVKCQDEVYVVEANLDPNNYLYQLLYNWTASGDEYMGAIKYSFISSSHQIETVLNIPEVEEKPLSIVLKYNQSGSVSAMFYSPYGLLGAEGSLILSETTIVISGTVYQSLFSLPEINLDMTIPLQISEKGAMKMVWSLPRWRTEMWLNTGEHLKTGGVGFLLNVDNENTTYSLTYDIKESLRVKGQFDDLELETIWTLKGTQILVSAGDFEVKSNFPGYEAIDGSWEMGYKNWQYYGQATLDVKHQQVFSISTTLDTLSEGASYPWQNVRFNLLMESPYTLPHHLHAEYQLLAPKLLLYYQHGLDTFKIQLNSDLRRNTATLALTGNIPVKGISTFDVNVAYNFLDSYSSSVVVKVEDSILEHKFDFSRDWRVGSVQVVFTSPFLKPTKTQISWSFVPNSITLKGFFNLGEHSGKMKISLENRRSSAKFDCHITTSLKELSQFIINLSYKVSGNNNFDASLAARMNNNGILVKSSLDTKGGKLLLKFQGTFEITGNRGSLDVDVGPSGNGYSASVVGKCPGYKKFLIDLYFDIYELKLNSMYDGKEVFVVSATYSETKMQLSWTEFWSLNLETRLQSKGRKYLFTMMFSGFGIDPIEVKASYSQKQSQLLKLSLTSSLLPNSTLQVTYSGNKVLVEVTIGEKTYTMSGRANLRRLQSSFDVRFESSEELNHPLVMHLEYDMTDLFMGRMKAVENLLQVTFEWEEKFQVNVTGLRNSNTAMIDIKADTPLKSLPHLHLGIQGKFFFMDFVGFNCSAFVEWSERVEMTAIATLMQANVDAEFTLKTSLTSLEKLSASLKLEPGQLQLLAQYNDDIWKAVWKYEFTPFLVTCSIETPIVNYEIISLTISIKTDDEKIGVAFDMIWPEEQKLGVQLEVEKWQVKLNFQTPWQPFTSGLFTVLLKTEGEELMVSTVIELDGQEAEVSFVLLQTNFKLLASYSKGAITIGQANLEYSHRDDSMKVSLDVKTPFENLESFETSLHFTDNKISLILEINDDKNIIEVMYSADGAEFKANIPLLNNFSWILTSENMWLKTETSITLKMASNSEPFSTSLKYDIDPEASTVRSTFSVVNDKELMSIDVIYDQELSFMATVMSYSLDLQVSNPALKQSAKLKIEAPELGLESLVVQMKFEFADKPTYHLDTTLHILVKQLGEDQFMYKIQGTFNSIENDLVVTVEFEGDGLPIYKVIIKIPNFAIGLHILVTENGDELLALEYSSGPQNDLFLPQKFEVRAPAWEGNGNLLLTSASFTGLLTLPQSSHHSFSISWPEELGLEEFELNARLESPFISNEALRFNMICSLPEIFNGKMNMLILFGDENIHIQGEYNYDKYFKTFKAELQMNSSWANYYSLLTNVQWKRNIHVTVSLETLDEEHSLVFHIDTTNSAIELIFKSLLLPVKKITFTGKISNPLDSSFMMFMSKLQADDQEIELEARFENDQLNNINYHVVLRKNYVDMFKLSLTMYEDNNRTDFDLEGKLLFENFEEVCHVRYYDADWGRYLNGSLSSHVLTEDISLIVINTHVLRDLQSFTLSGPNFKFHGESNVAKGISQVTISFGYDEIDLFVSGNIFDEQRIGIQLKSTFINYEVLSVYAIWSGPEKEIAAEYSGNGEMIIFNGILQPDDLFVYSIDVILKTSFEHYEKFALYTPRYKDGKQTKALVEYPEGKVGVDITLNYKEISESDFVISLYLPYEEFSVISLKYRMHLFYDKDRVSYYEIEARIGKIGISLSSSTKSLINGVYIETVTSLNEYKGKSIFLLTHAKHKRVTARYTYILEPKELIECYFFHGKMFYEVNDRIFLMVRDNKVDWIKVHIAWNADKILTLVTPKYLPGYIHVNLEHGSLRDDYHFEFGLLTADKSAWSMYGLQLHKEALPGGHHFSILGQSGEYLIGATGTLSANACHFNNSLVFALNKNKMGYKALFLSEPGFLSRTYTSDIQVLLHNTTLHHHTQAKATIKSLDLISNFTWNKKDEHIPPITFIMNYDDEFFFGNGKKYLNVVLSHPDIKDISLLANITRTHNSSLLGSAQLVDENSPEMKMVATMEVEPVRDDGSQSVSLSLSQPVSNFTMLVEAQLKQDPLTEVLCKLKYYSLTSQTWHQVNLSTSLESQGSGRVLRVAVVVPEKDWGHTWMGTLDSRPEEFSLSLEGSSLEIQDTWKFRSIVKRHMPELLVYLNVGKEQEVYEEARVRLGLHSPVEAGAAVDHFRFGEWHQDAALGFRLASPQVLQAFLDFDPSLGCKDYRDWVYLFSPTMEVFEVWQRDMVTTAQNLQQWAATEGPAVMEVLINNTVALAVWQREASNWDYFLKDVQDTYQGIGEDLTTLWESVLIPVFEALKDYTIRIYMAAWDYLAALKDLILQSLERIRHWLQNVWDSFLSKFFFVEAAVREGLVGWGISLGQGASAFWINLHQWVTRLGDDIIREVTNLWEEAKIFFIMVGETVKGYLSIVFQAIQPYFEGLPEAFHRYGQEVLAEFSGPCWMAITDKWDNLVAMSQNLDGMRVVSEFLQIEKYYSHLMHARDWLKNKVVSVWSSIYETLSEAVEKMVYVFSSLSPAFIERVETVWNSLPELSIQLANEGLYSLVMTMTESLRERVSQMASQLPMLLRESIKPMHTYLTQFSVLKCIDGVMMGIYDWGESAWQRWKSGEHTNLGFLEQQLFLLGDAVRNYFIDTNYLADLFYVFKPRVLGHIVYNQYLPGHWTSFMELPSWTFPTHLFQTESPTSEAERLMVASPSPSLLQSLVPSYTATAVIAGQHITTFDLQHYQFLGSCSYLLAKDFEGGDFEVFGVYETEAGATSLKSVVVHSMDNDVTLSVDGSVTSMENNAMVHNSTDYSALSLPDLFVSCSRALHGCALTVSVKYFNRLGGLLGNYNGDASDDLQGPGGQMAQDAAHLATLWAISPTPCYQANQANIVEDYNDVDEESVRECSQLFLYDTSPLSNCFHVIDPHSYFTHCIQGHTHPAFNEHDLNSPCTAVSSYRTQCWARHIHLPDLDKCKNESSSGCVVEGKEVPYGWSQVFEETSHGSADVALIVELTDCNAGRDVASLFDYLTRQLERKNINDVHYSVVAVGKDETITKSFLTKGNTTDFLNTLTLNETTALENIESVVASTASKIEWRPGVSRSIVHIGCQVCKRGDEATKALHQNDVTYHLLSGLMVEMAGTRQEAQARTRKLFGFDESLVYTPADFKKFNGNEKLRLALRSPKGGCVSTALSTGGSVFDTNKWIPKRAIQARKFLSVLAKRVAASSSAPKCQECHCLKGDSRTMPTCFKCFGNSMFLITEVDNNSSYRAKDNNSITSSIKKSFQENFLKSNSNTTMLRIL